MSDHDELLKIARQVKERVLWLERGGVGGVPEEKSRVESRGSRVPERRPAAPTANLAPAAATANPNPNPDPKLSTLDSRLSTSLALVRADLGDCTRCKLHPLRKNIVFGVGSPDAPLVFVGEAPGGEEDRTGEPFVGAAGQLLTKMIQAMGLGREEVYIANILKCRPPGNRNPEPDEIAECEPFLKRQLAAIRPRMIVALGKFAAQCLLRSDAPISRLRGRFQEYEGIPLMPTFHPAFLLRNPAAKREVWADLQLVMAELDRLGIPRRRA